MNINPKVHNRTKFLRLFLGFKGIEEIDKFFNKKSQYWLLQNSHIVNYHEVDQNNHFIAQYDDKGNIKNADFSKTTIDKIPLTEKDFIESELKFISNIDLKFFNLNERKKIQFYTNYLADKNISVRNNTIGSSGENNNLINQHPNIFSGRGFDIFNDLFIDLKINEKSRTDVKFIFEEMKKDGLVFKTVKQKAFLEWIFDNYNLDIEKTSNYSKTTYRVSLYSQIKKQYHE